MEPTGRIALVLSGGGARAAYQVGVITAIAERYPSLSFPILTGVSAGAINIASLAAHTGELRDAINALQAEWRGLTTDDVFRFQPGDAIPAMLRGVWHFASGRSRGAPAVRGLLDSRPLGDFLSRTIDFGAIKGNIGRGRLRAVALSATSYSTGITTTFVQGTGDLVMWRRAMRVAVRQDLGVNHVVASAAIPLIFQAIRIGDEYFGDGSLRQTAPLAPAIHLGAEKILTISMRARRGDERTTGEAVSYPSSAEVTGLLLNSIFLDALDTDAERLERLNSVLAALPPEHARVDDLKHLHLLKLVPSRDLGEMARGLRVDFPPSVSFLLRGVGGSRRTAGDFLSYLMFEPAYTGRLMELGYEDARARYSEIDEFLAR